MAQRDTVSGLGSSNFPPKSRHTLYVVCPAAGVDEKVAFFVVMERTRLTQSYRT